MTVLFFSFLRDVTGQEQVELRLDGAVDAAELWRRLIDRFPALAPYRTGVRLARGCEYVLPDARFEDGDEVALIPPVSGG